MDATLWIELAKAAIAAASAGAQVFADKTKSIEERLEKKPKTFDDDFRNRLKEISENED